MRQAPPYSLWLGHVGDARELRNLLNVGIRALVDLALNEPPVAVTREMVYCRFPLVDGADNPPWLLKAAIGTAASFLHTHTSTLVYCSAGMSRSPAIAAAAIALLSGRPADDCLLDLVRDEACDVGAGLWHDVRRAVVDLGRGRAGSQHHSGRVE